MGKTGSAVLKLVNKSSKLEIGGRANEALGHKGTYMMRKLRPSKIIALGMIFLAVASVGQWWLQRHSGYSESVADFASGILQGIAIGTLLFGIWKQSRRPKD